MIDRARYHQAMEVSPVTAWTKIAHAVQSASPGSKKSLSELVTLYDKPLQTLFESIVGSDTALAEDWKQDFVITHLLTAKVFQAAKPIGRFRTFLAVAVRNYVANRRKADGARKRRAEAGARIFSQIGSESGEQFGDSIGDSATVDGYEAVLTRARAWDIYNGSMGALEHWCAAQQDAADLAEVVRAMKSSEKPSAAFRRPSPKARKVVAQFKELLRRGIREELLVQPGEDEQFVAGREIGILFDALKE